MAFGLEYFATLNPFPFGIIGVISSFVFLFAFAYIVNRTKSNAFDIALETISYSLLVGFILFIMNLPPLWMGFGYLAGYILSVKYVSKLKADFSWVVLNFYLIFIFVVVAVLDDFSRLWFVIFAIVVLFVISEIDVYKKALEKPKK